MRSALQSLELRLDSTLGAHLSETPLDVDDLSTADAADEERPDMAHKRTLVRASDLSS